MAQKTINNIGRLSERTVKLNTTEIVELSVKYSVKKYDGQNVKAVHCSKGQRKCPQNSIFGQILAGQGC